MNIYHTKLISDYAQEHQFELSEFIQRFSDWKEKGEFSSYFFGKDGFYSPIEAGLKHVHLVPIMSILDKINWDLNWKNGKRRTSDTCLVYVEDGQDYLLINILPESLAHEIARQATEDDRQIMRFFREIAEQFFYYRNIIA